MAFIYCERDLVSFYIKSSFSTRDEIISEYIRRGDEVALLSSIHRYMERTNKNSNMAKIAVRRPATPSLIKYDL
tara:strand:+ start:1505 stop:1726 length:222 start_codon:yes stop_codon:yes gene_type:complete